MRDLSPPSRIRVRSRDGRERSRRFGIALVHLLVGGGEDIVGVQQRKIPFEGFPCLSQDLFSIPAPHAQEKFRKAVVEEEISLHYKVNQKPGCDGRGTGLTVGLRRKRPRGFRWG